MTLADFCPYVQEFTWKSNNGEIAPRGTRCTASENQPDSESDYALENYGEESRCFEQGSKWNQKSCNAMKQWRRYGAGCYNYRDAKCHPSDSFERMASKASKGYLTSSKLNLSMKRNFGRNKAFEVSKVEWLILIQ